ncbi:hypothetical protein M405DRAFT_817789 [Rhizopogon salebrosus TDB-379]|nr:hypothetical protein M405DRAFT_817789 [Rhizopogon salebrosus TDB-379]
MCPHTPFPSFSNLQQPPLSITRSTAPSSSSSNLQQPPLSIMRSNVPFPSSSQNAHPGMIKQMQFTFSVDKHALPALQQLSFTQGVCLHSDGTYQEYLCRALQPSARPSTSVLAPTCPPTTLKDNSSKNMPTNPPAPETNTNTNTSPLSYLSQAHSVTHTHSHAHTQPCARQGSLQYLFLAHQGTGKVTTAGHPDPITPAPFPPILVHEDDHRISILHQRLLRALTTTSTSPCSALHPFRHMGRSLIMGPWILSTTRKIQSYVV